MVSGLLAVEGWRGETSDSLLMYSVGRNWRGSVCSGGRCETSRLLARVVPKRAVEQNKGTQMHCRSDHCHKELMKPKKGVEL